MPIQGPSCKVMFTEVTFLITSAHQLRYATNDSAQATLVVRSITVDTPELMWWDTPERWCAYIALSTSYCSLVCIRKSNVVVR